MNESWTDAERLAAEVLASGSDGALRDLLAELDRGFPGQGSKSASRSSPSPSRRRFFFRRRSAGTRASRSAIRPRAGWRDSGFLNWAVDLVVVVVALACIAVGTRPLASPIADAGPSIAEALEGVSLPAAPDAGSAPQIAAVSAAERPVSASEPISLQARSLEETIGRYNAVAGMYGDRKLPCSQLRESYTEVEGAWTRYSIARGRTYGDRIPAGLVKWDEALYEAVRDVDRQFTASGCNRP